MKNKITSYRLSDNEILLLNNVKKVYLGNGFSSEMLPEIYYSNFYDAKLNFNVTESEMLEENYIYNPDYLGEYHFSNSEEGIIILYRDRILNAAHKLYAASSNNFQSFDEVIKLLKAKVLIHEIGHWLTHYCSIINKNDLMLAFSFLPKIIIESMAQLTVLWSFSNHTTDFEYKLENFSRIFIPMQPFPYYEFKDIKNMYSPAIIIKRYWGIASQFTHLNENSLFALLCKDEDKLTTIDKKILAGKFI